MLCILFFLVDTSKKKHPVLPDTPPKEGELRTTSPLEGCLKGGVDSKDK